MTDMEKGPSDHFHMDGKRGFFTNAGEVADAHMAMEENDLRHDIWNRYLEDHDWPEMLWVYDEDKNGEPDIDTDPISWENIRQGMEDFGMLSDDADFTMTRGDQIASPNLYQMAVRAVADPVARELNEHGYDTEFNHIAATWEPFHPNNAKHRLAMWPVVFEDGGVRWYRLGDTEGNSQPINDIGVDEFAAGNLAHSTGYERGIDVENGKKVGYMSDFMLSQEDVDPAAFLHRGANSLGNRVEGDVNKFSNYVVGDLIDAGLQPRSLKFIVGEGTAGDEDLSGQDKASITLLWDEYEQVYKPWAGGTDTKDTWGGAEITRSVEDARNEGFLPAPQNYEFFLPGLALASTYVQPRGVGVDDKFSTVYMMEDVLEDMEEVPFDTVPMISPASMAADQEGNPVTSLDYADLMNRTYAAGEGERWDPAEGPINYHEEAILLGPMLTGEQIRDIEDQMMPEVYDALGVDDPRDVYFPEFAREFTRRSTEYLESEVEQ